MKESSGARMPACHRMIRRAERRITDMESPLAAAERRSCPRWPSLDTASCCRREASGAPVTHAWCHQALGTFNLRTRNASVFWSPRASSVYSSLAERCQRAGRRMRVVRERRKRDREGGRGEVPIRAASPPSSSGSAEEVYFFRGKDQQPS